MTAQESTGKTFLYTNALNNIGIFHSKANIGLSQRLTKRHILDFETNLYTYNWIYKEPTNGASFDLIYKYEPTPSRYYSFGCKFGAFNYTTESWFSNEQSYNDSTYFDYKEKYDIEKKFMEFNIRTGKRYYYSAFMFDIFIGMGIRSRIISHLNRTDNDHFFASRLYAKDIRDEDRNGTFPFLKLGVLIGLKLF